MFGQRVAEFGRVDIRERFLRTKAWRSIKNTALGQTAGQVVQVIACQRAQNQ
jgi:hypothetical protein